jgi:hypothetical protein
LLLLLLLLSWWQPKQSMVLSWVGLDWFVCLVGCVVEAARRQANLLSVIHNLDSIPVVLKRFQSVLLFALFQAFNVSMVVRIGAYIRCFADVATFKKGIGNVRTILCSCETHYLSFALSPRSSLIDQGRHV